RTQRTPMLGIANPPAERKWLLPFSEWEVEQILHLVEGMCGDSAVRHLVGASATVEKVIQALPAHPIVHLSCHGQWDFNEPLQSALMLAGGDLTLARLLEQTLLEKAHLVVLSACESSTGFQPGSADDEYLGLPAGFIFAGAKAVVGSLWSVLDPPTALLMVKMYERLLAGMGVAAALREA